MDREFLADYSSRVKSERQALFETIVSANREKTRELCKNRLRRAHDPIALAVDGESIWPQIPLYGTLVIDLVPAPTSVGFRDAHGFDISDIGRLVDFAKDTGHVAFNLVQDPLDYQGLEFLNPIFLELEPLLRISTLFRFHDEVDLKSRFKHPVEEFNALAEVGIASVGDQRFPSEVSGMHETTLSDIVHGAANLYAGLCALGYKQMTQSARDILVEDPLAAVRFLKMCHDLLTRPSADPLGMIHNVSLPIMKEMLSGVPNDAASLLNPQKVGQYYVPEIGEFLLKKLSPYPESFEGCRVLCDTFRHYDLARVFNTLNQAVNDLDYESIKSSGRILAEQLDTIWKESDSMKTRSDFVRAGLTIASAIIGSVAGGPIGAVGGLMAGLGFATAEKLLELKTDSISETIAKWTAPPYLVNIFDFKTRYRVIT
jgi:hypothetical protein